MLEGDACGIRIGEQMRLIPANCDPTVNLHEWYVVVRDGRVVATWPIVARGPGY
jgi:3-hydroxy-D-aspartate aldolase